MHAELTNGLLLLRPCIPERRGKKPRSGRKPDTTNNHHWRAERAFAWLGNFRCLLVRHERVLSVYQGFFLLACVLLCWTDFCNSF